MQNKRADDNDSRLGNIEAETQRKYCNFNQRFLAYLLLSNQNLYANLSSSSLQGMEVEEKDYYL